MGTGLTLLFALWPLLDIPRVPPALILRQDVEPRLPGRRPWLAAVPIVAGLAALAVWEAGSLKVGAIFIGGLAAALVLLAAGARLVIEAARRLPRLRSLAWRQAVANLHAPARNAGTVLMSLGLAVMLIVAWPSSSRACARSWPIADPDARPLSSSSTSSRIRPRRSAVSSRTRRGGSHADPGGPLATGLDQRRARLPGMRASVARRSGTSRAKYVLTWAAQPPPENPWWPDAGGRRRKRAREPLISVEEEIAKNLGVGIGSTLGFDIQGVHGDGARGQPAAGGVADLPYQTSS
jgi:putative ABC transport system permease protein